LTPYPTVLRCSAILHRRCGGNLYAATDNGVSISKYPLTAGGNGGNGGGGGDGGNSGFFGGGGTGGTGGTAYPGGTNGTNGTNGR